MNQAALEQYTAAGGRVFGSHYHYAWFNTGPFGADNLATWTTGGNPITSTNFADLLDIDAVINQKLSDGGVFPKGQALDQWLGVVGALETSGDLQIAQGKHNADVGAANVHSQSWIYADTDTSNPGATEYFSFNTPVDAGLDDAGDPAYCGRVVYSDLHVGAASGDYGQKPGDTAIPMGAMTPSGCANNALSPQEKALEFMLFDLSGCITPPDQGAGGVMPPPTK
jgi:hypothetical protein